MSPEAQRIAIAKFCGWNHPHYSRNLSESTGADVFRGQPPGVRNYYADLPDYGADLNAMHKAENGLQEKQIKTWLRTLRGVVTRDASVWLDNLTERATAAQRAEALLRTIAKWEQQP